MLFFFFFKYLNFAVADLVKKIEEQKGEAERQLKVLNRQMKVRNVWHGVLLGLKSSTNCCLLFQLGSVWMIFYRISIKTDISGNSDAPHIQHLFFLYLPKSGNQLNRSAFFRKCVFSQLSENRKACRILWVSICANIYKYHLRVNGSYLIFTLMHLVS